MRLTAYSAAGAGAWLKAIPSLNQDRNNIKCYISNHSFHATWHCYLWSRFGMFFLPPELGPPRPSYHDLNGPRTQTTHAYFLSQHRVSPCPTNTCHTQIRTNKFTPQQSPTAPCGYLNYGPPGYPHLILAKIPPTCIGLCHYKFFPVSDPTGWRTSPLVSGIRYTDLNDIPTKQ